MVQEFSNGLMVEFLRVIGKMENKMEKENFIIRKMEYGEKEYGKMEKEFNGYKKINNMLKEF